VFLRARAIFLFKAAQLLDMPITVFGEQYPKAFGHVRPDIDTSTGIIAEKSSFSLYNLDGKMIFFFFLQYSDLHIQLFFFSKTQS
jgi:hypothetical protein